MAMYASAAAPYTEPMYSSFDRSTVGSAPRIQYALGRYVLFIMFPILFLVFLKKQN